MSEVYSKPNGAKVQVNADGSWIAQTPGHMTKEGVGLENLQTLMSGKAVVFEAGQTPPWKNSSKSIGAPPETVTAPLSVINQKWKALSDAAPTPTEKEKQSVGTYSGSHYKQLNEKLRHEPGWASDTVKNIDSWLNKSSIPEDIEVYRGVGGEYAKILKSILHDGAKFIDRGFISTSIRENMGFVSGASLKMKINVPKGSKGAALGSLSHHQGEHEVLLPRNTMLVVTKYDPKAQYVECTIEQGHFQ